MEYNQNVPGALVGYLEMKGVPVAGCLPSRLVASWLLLDCCLLACLGGCFVSWLASWYLQQPSHPQEADI